MTRSDTALGFVLVGAVAVLLSVWAYERRGK